MNDTLLWFWGGIALLLLNCFMAVGNIVMGSYYVLPVSAIGIVASLAIIYGAWKRL